MIREPQGNGSPITDIELADHELSVAEFSNFELNLQLRDGRITATFENYVNPFGVRYIRLLNPVLTFDAAPDSEVTIEKLCRANGFRRRTQ